MVALLIVPTSLMGGTLPVLSAYTKRFQTGLSRRVGILYGSNTLGAFVGVVGSGLYAIGAWGEWQTIFCAALLNLAVSLLAFRMSRAPAVAEIAAATGADGAKAGSAVLTHRKLILWAYAASGFAAISYEIVWTRMFQIELGTSICAFSMMLGFYLLGIGLGSLAGGMLVRKINNSLKLFGWLQVAVALYGVAGMYLLLGFDPVTLIQDIVLSNIITVPLLIVTPLTLVLGLMFPVVSSLYVEERETGRGVGRLYSANTAGCIAGSLVCGFLLIGALGTRGTMLLLAGMNAMLGAAILLVDGRRRAVLSAGLSVAVVAAVALLSPDPIPDGNRQVGASDLRRSHPPGHLVSPPGARRGHHHGAWHLRLSVDKRALCQRHWNDQTVHGNQAYGPSAARAPPESAQHSRDLLRHGYGPQIGMGARGHFLRRR